MPTEKVPDNWEHIQTSYNAITQGYTMSTGMKVVLERVPPGDNWKFVQTTLVYNSLTDALNAVFDATGITDFYVEARKGTVSYAVEESGEIVVRSKKFNIYGDG